MSEELPKELEPESTGALPTDMNTLAGELINEKYRLKKAIAKGGMGVIYIADQLVLNREVAIKLILQQTDPIAEKRFLQEASLAAKIDHPNVVCIYDFGKDQKGRMYLVMELLQGMPLNEYIRSLGPLSVEATIELGLQLAEALIAVHSNGIIHRDIKPANIFMLKTPGNRVCSRLIDFGLVKVLNDEEQVKTQTGFVLGSPMYMAPEQITSDPVDGRTDIYSLGLTLYYALTGHSPYSNDNIAAMLHNQLINPPQPMGILCPDRDFPINLEWLINTAIRKRPESRIQSPEQMLRVFQFLKNPNNLFQPLSFNIHNGLLHNSKGEKVELEHSEPPTLKQPFSTSISKKEKTKETLFISDFQGNGTSKNLLFSIIGLVTLILSSLLYLQYSKSSTTDKHNYVLNSKPNKADVYQDDILMGSTPMNYSLAGDQQLIVTIRKEGFEDQKLILNATNPNPKINLKKRMESLEKKSTDKIPVPQEKTENPDTSKTGEEVTKTNSREVTKTEPKKTKRRNKKIPSKKSNATIPKKKNGDLKDPWAK